MLESRVGGEQVHALLDAEDVIDCDMAADTR